MIISLIGYIQDVFQMFIMIHVTSLVALDGQESAIEYSFINILILCDELITRPEESYRLWCVVVCDLENLKNEEAITRVGSQRHKKKS
jgi:hypothetical protein